MFLVIVVLMAAYFFYGRNTSYEVRVTNVPVGSSVKLNGSPIAVSDDRGAAVLQNIKSGEHTVTIEHPTRSCDTITIRDTVKEVVAQCKEIKAASTDDCGNIKFGEDDKAERCYNSALDALPDPFTPEDLVKALNILIINFASASSEVPQKRLAALKKGAEFIRKLPATVVLEVGGHTDSDGEPDSNKVLSEARSKAVKEVLMKFGVKSDMLQTKGHGSTVAIATNDTEDGKYRNRRIEYSVLRK
jgi:outer membrane protein OmpA-like peptidoglycan-associated protein